MDNNNNNQRGFGKFSFGFNNRNNNNANNEQQQQQQKPMSNYVSSNFQTNNNQQQSKYSSLPPQNYTATNTNTNNNNNMTRGNFTNGNNNNQQQNAAFVYNQDASPMSKLNFIHSQMKQQEIQQQQQQQPGKTLSFSRMLKPVVQESNNNNNQQQVVNNNNNNSKSVLSMNDILSSAASKHQQVQQKQQQQQQQQDQMARTKTKETWYYIFGEARESAENFPRPPTDDLTLTKKRLEKELEILSISIETKRRTALLRKESLAEYEKALKSLGDDDPNAKKALELWKVLDQTSQAVSSNLQSIRERFEKEQREINNTNNKGNENDEEEEDEDDQLLFDPNRDVLDINNNNNNKNSSQLSQRSRNVQNGEDLLSGKSEFDLYQTAMRAELSVPEAVRLLRLSGEFQGNLLPFQEESLAFFLNLAARGIHGLNADEMGNGKSVQSISVFVASRHIKRIEFINKLKKEALQKRKTVAAQQRRGAPAVTIATSKYFSAVEENNFLLQANAMLNPTIIVVPLSTSSSWETEFQTFAPNLKIGVLGLASDRAAMLAEFFGEKTATTTNSKKPTAKRAPKRRGRKNSSSEDEDSDEDDEDSETDSSNSSSDDDDDDELEYSEESDSSDDRRKLKNRLRAARRAPPAKRAPAPKRGSAAAAAAAATTATATKQYGFDVLIVPQHFFSQMSRNQLSMKYTAKLARVPWHYIIIDEAHRIKNDSAALTTALRQFKNVEHRLVLTGTPLQNSLDELWTLLSFLLPEVFAKDQFVSLFKAIADIHAIPDNRSDHPSLQQNNNKAGKKPRGKNAANNNNNNNKLLMSAFEEEQAKALAEERQFLLCRKIHDVLLPLMVRREKKDVIAELPKLSEWYVICPNAALQEYEANLFLKKNAESAIAEEKQAINAMLMDSKKVAADFALQQQQQQQQNDDQQQQQQTTLSIFTERRLALHPFMLRKPQAVKASLCDEQVQTELFKGSGKFLILDLFLKFIFQFNQKVLECKRQGIENSAEFPYLHKVLIFSQFASLLELVETHVGWCRNFPYLKLDGGTGDRAQLIKEFKTNDDQFIFLLTKGAGGVGLNLQAADTVILLDIDYNPTMDSQSISRVYRVGQRKDVLVMKFVSDFAAEKSVMKIASKKQDLENKVILAGKFDTKTGDEERNEALREMMNKKKKNVDEVAAQKTNKRRNATNFDNDDDYDEDEDEDEQDQLADQQEHDDSALDIVTTAQQPYKVANMRITNNNSKTSSAVTPATSSTLRKNASAAFPTLSTKDQQRAKIRSVIKKEILRVFPRTKFEQKFLENLIQETDFLDDAVENFYFTTKNNNSNNSLEISTENIPQCLLIPDNNQWKSGTVNLAADIAKENQIVGPRQNRLIAEKQLEERRRKIESGELDEDDDEEEFW